MKARPLASDPSVHPRSRVHRSASTFALTAITSTAILLVGLAVVLVLSSRHLGTPGRVVLAAAAVLAATEVALLAGPLGRWAARAGRDSALETASAAAARDYLDAVLESVDTGVLLVGAGGTILEVNAAFVAIAGLEPGTGAAGVRAAGVALRVPSSGVTIPLDSVATGDALGERAAARRLHLVTPGREAAAVLVRARPLRHRDGRVDGAVVSVVDVAQLAEQRRALERRTEQLEAVAAAAYAVQRDDDARRSVCEVTRQLTGAVAVSLFEPDSPETLRCSASTNERLVGLSVDLGHPSVMATAYFRSVPVYVSESETRPDLDLEKLAEVEALTGGAVTGASYVPLGTDRDFRGLLVVTYSSSAGSSPEEDLAALSVLAAQAGIAVEREDMVTSLRSEATTDSLTELGNRRSWDRALSRAIDRARRSGTALTAAMLDLDHFKQYNDRHGHLAGDELLRSASAAWRAELRPGDVICRTGGEEFAVILPDCDLDDARLVVDRLRSVTPSGETCSAGVAALEPGDDPASLMVRVDSLLYEAKRDGRNRTAVARPAGSREAAVRSPA
ncbi:MAG: diguanylate cyclase [Actinomycetota bacterium]|nr:diguanylate cyclase [Actinomycetota bacterium]